MVKFVKRLLLFMVVFAAANAFDYWMESNAIQAVATEPLPKGAPIVPPAEPAAWQELATGLIRITQLPSLVVLGLCSLAGMPLPKSPHVGLCIFHTVFSAIFYAAALSILFRRKRSHASASAQPGQNPGDPI